MARYSPEKKKAVRAKNAERVAAGKKPIGRKPKPFSVKMFESLCEIQCTRDEICAVMGMSDVTLNQKCMEHYGATFLVAFEQKRKAGFKALRRAQFDTAVKKGNAIMQIWLGKNLLGQTDKTTEPEDDPDDFAAKARKAIEEMDKSIGGKP